MAIITEYYKTRSDGVRLFRAYSTLGLRIRKVGTDEIYDEAIDVENSGFVYEETGDFNEETGDFNEEIPAEDLKTMIEEII